jgi:hypothetical protein
MIVAIHINCEASKEVQRESRLRVNVDEIVGVVMVLRLVIQSHPAVFAIRHVDVVSKTCGFLHWIAADLANIALLNRTAKLGAYLHC